MKKVFNAKFILFALLATTIVVSLTSSSDGTLKNNPNYVFHLDNEKIMEQIMFAPPSKDTLLLQPGVVVVKVKNQSTSGKASTHVTIQSLDNNTSYSAVLTSGEQMVQEVEGGNWAIIASTSGKVTITVEIIEY